MDNDNKQDTWGNNHHISSYLGKEICLIYLSEFQGKPLFRVGGFIHAVALGADFYDGDGDGNYNPTDDKDGDGQWDPDEDMPDLIGDELAWCVFHDGLPVAQRRWNTTKRQVLK